MLKWIKSWIWKYEEPTITPNSMALMPKDKYYNELIWTEKYIKKLMDKKTNVYLDAQEAVNLGIADIIV